MRLPGGENEMVGEQVAITYGDLVRRLGRRPADALSDRFVGKVVDQATCNRENKHARTHARTVSEQKIRRTANRNIAERSAAQRT